MKKVLWVLLILVISTPLCAGRWDIAGTYRGATYRGEAIVNVTGLSDDFNRSDGDSLGAKWTEDTGDFDIDTNVLKLSSASTNTIAINTTSIDSVNGYAKYTIMSTTNHVSYPGFIVRYTNSDSPFYLIDHPWENCRFKWYYVADATFGTLELLHDNEDVGDCTSGDSFGVTWTGTGDDTVVNIFRDPVSNAPISSSEWDSGSTPDVTFADNPGEYAVDTGSKAGLKGYSSNLSTREVLIDDVYLGALSDEIPEEDSDILGIWFLTNDDSDESDAGNDLTPVNAPTYENSTPTQVRGTYSALLEAASTQYFSNSDITITGNFTFGTWVYLNSDTNESYTLLSNADGEAKAIKLYIDTTFKANAIISSDGSASTVNAEVGASIPILEWSHIVFRYDGTEVSCFINGQEDVGNTFPYLFSGSIYNPSNDFFIGYDARVTDDKMDGNLNETFLYSKALTDEEILNIYTYGLDGIGAEDTTPPTIGDPPSVRQDGLTIDVAFSEEINGSGYVDGDMTITCTTTGTDNLTSINCDDLTCTFVTADTIDHDGTDTCTLAFNGRTGSLRDLAGNDLVQFSGEEVTNNSTQGGGTPAQTYWVDSNGAAAWVDCQSATELTGAAACSLATANDEVTPGDTVYMSDTGDYDGQQIKPDVSGASGNVITFIANDGASPTIINQGTAIDLTNRSYIVIDGIDVDGEQEGDAADVNTWVEMENGNNNTVQNCVFTKAKGWPGIHIKNSDYNKILDNTMSYVGSQARDNGDMIEIFAGDYNLISGNTCSYAGHNLLLVDGNYNIVKDNDFSNQWERCFTVREKPPRTSIRTVFTNNIIRDASPAIDNATPPAFKWVAPDGIFRLNKIYGNTAYGIQISVANDWPDASDNRIYGNTFHDNGSYTATIFHNVSGCTTSNNKWINNIFSEGTTYEMYYNVVGVGFDGNYMLNNLFWNGSAGGNIVRIRDYGIKSVAYFNTNYPAFFDNIESDPLFTDKGSADFTLQSGSPARNTGGWLTYTNGTGSNSTQLVVDDANVFSDGHGIITGDTIQFEGSVSTYTITNVNYTTNTITLSSAATWADGVGVAMEYNGAAPDIGAEEYTE